MVMTLVTASGCWRSAGISAVTAIVSRLRVSVVTAISTSDNCSCSRKLLPLFTARMSFPDAPLAVFVISTLTLTVVVTFCRNKTLAGS